MPVAPAARVNIRATTDRDFWGTGLPHDLYLWDGAQHDRTLREMESGDTPTLPDPFSSRAATDAAQARCRGLYEKLLPLLTQRLNAVHDLDLPPAFWRTAMGYWLFRHICIVYEKFTVLSMLDIDETSISLLSPESYYTPNDHFDYLRCFCHDFGVQQLVSLYCDLFAQKDFQRKSKTCGPALDPSTLQPRQHLVLRPPEPAMMRLFRRRWWERRNRLRRRHVDPRVAVCGIHTSDYLARFLARQEVSDIARIDLPRVPAYERPLMGSARQALSAVPAEDRFERYLAASFVHAFPKILVEHFQGFYRTFAEDVEQRRFSHFVTEYWRSFFPISIYAAVARTRDRKLVFQEHGASIHWLNKNLSWLERANADAFVTTGWKAEDPGVVPGGFICRDITPHRFDPEARDILYIGTTRFCYRKEIGESDLGANFIRRMKMMRDFIEGLPTDLAERLVMRPRKVKYFWDVARILELEKTPVRIDTGDIAQSMARARILVIDHLSTVIGEILANKAPFLLIHDEGIEFLEEEYADLFKDLAACGVVHPSAASAVDFLVENYPRIPQWWFGDAVQAAVDALASAHIGPPSRTTDFLLACAGKESPRSGKHP